MIHLPSLVSEGLNPTVENLKAFSAAFGTTASVAMFHIAGVTPEATDAKTALSLGLDEIDEDSESRLNRTTASTGSGSGEDKDNLYIELCLEDFEVRCHIFFWGGGSIER